MPVPAFVAALVASLIVILAGALVTGVVALAAPDLLRRVDPQAPTAVVVAIALVVALAMALELTGLA